MVRPAMPNTTTTPPPGKTPLEVFCKRDGQRWTIAFLPMPMAKVARLMRAARCPSCASGRQVFIATEPQE